MRYHITVVCFTAAVVLLIRGPAQAASPSKLAVVPPLWYPAALTPVPRDDKATEQFFGQSLDVDGSLAVAGTAGPMDQENGGFAAVLARTAPGQWDIAARLAPPAAVDSRVARFGASVAISKALVVVGALSHAENAGAAYVFVQDDIATASGWTRTATLEQAGPARFGFAVAAHEGVILVGTYESSSVVYVYESTAPADGTGRYPGSWSLVQTLAPPSGAKFMGSALDMDGRRAVVAAYDKYARSGTTYVYSADGTGASGGGLGGAWGLVMELQDARVSAGVGGDVAISGDIIVAGAPSDDVRGPLSGSAVVFAADDPTPSAATWKVVVRCALC